MKRRFWKGEVQTHEGLQFEFPPRDTKEEAFDDAQSWCTEPIHIPVACEWEGDEDYAENTGNYYEGVDALKIKPDMEYDAADFWHELQRTMPSVSEELRRNGIATVPQETWLSIQKIEGFSGGPAHAPTALRTVD